MVRYLSFLIYGYGYNKGLLSFCPLISLSGSFLDQFLLIGFSPCIFKLMYMPDNFLLDTRHGEFCLFECWIFLYS